MPRTSIQLAGGWQKVEEGAVAAEAIIREEEIILAAGFAELTKAVALDFLNQMVYDQPEDPRYARTHRTFDAVKARVVTAGPEILGEAYVDETHFDFPYYLVLELGTDNWFWWGHPADRPYRPRPFWSSTKAVVRAQFRAMEDAALTRITTRIATRFA